jgi:hypothetical protein
MRTHQQLLDEIELRKVLGLPRVQLTEAERARAFGDQNWADRDAFAREKELVERLQAGLPMSHADKKLAKQYLRG